MTLIKHGTVIPLDDQDSVIHDAAVLIEDGKIAKIGPSASFTGKYDTVIDARGKVVMPGFINAHMHFYSTFACGLSGLPASRDFNEVLRNLWWRLDRALTPEDCYSSALIALIAAIRKGTTTLIDHHASPSNVRGSLDQIARAVKDTGLRASLCYEVSDRDGPEIAAAGIEENAAFLRRCREEGDEHLRGLFGLHASFTVGDETLSRAVKAAREVDAGFHVHVAEAKSDQDPIERFYKAGVLGPKTICAHCVHINEHEMDLLAKTDTSVVHNPQSNMNNAVGIADIIGMTKKGVRVGLGTDAMTVNMLEEMRAAVWLQKLGRSNPSAGFMEALGTLLRNNAHIADQYWNIGLGRLKEGGAADVILIDYEPATPLNSSSLLGHICFGLAESNVDTTIVAGRVLMRGKQLIIPLDEGQVTARARELAAALWKRM